MGDTAPATSSPRVLAAVATPFARSGDVDLAAFEAHVRWLAAAGIDGVFVAGTTGEGVLLEVPEVEALVARAAAACAGMQVVAQVGRPSTRATAALARRALAAGAHAVAAYVPWFYRASQAQVREHFLDLLAAAGDAPAWLYTIPSLTGNDLSAELAGELARAGFAAMKDSSGDFARHEAYLAAVADVEGFDVHTGTEAHLARAVRAGAAGSVNGLSNCAPELLVALRDALRAGRHGEADRLAAEAGALKAALRKEGPSVRAIKARVRARLAEAGMDYPAAPRAPFT